MWGAWRQEPRSEVQGAAPGGLRADGGAGAAAVHGVPEGEARGRSGAAADGARGGAARAGARVGGPAGAAPMTDAARWVLVAWFAGAAAGLGLALLAWPVLRLVRWARGAVTRRAVRR
jgi:hypothetical protein